MSPPFGATVVVVARAFCSGVAGISSSGIDEVVLLLAGSAVDDVLERDLPMVTRGPVGGGMYTLAGAVVAGVVAGAVVAGAVVAGAVVAGAVVAGAVVGVVSVLTVSRTPAAASARGERHNAATGGTERTSNSVPTVTTDQRRARACACRLVTRRSGSCGVT